jgi:hypothetical protein
MPRPTQKLPNSALPVFFDPTRHRWIAIKSLSSLALACILSLLTVLFVSILNGPKLEGSSLSSPEHRIIVRQPGLPAGAPRVGPNVLESGIAGDVVGFFPEEPTPSSVTRAVGSTP